MFSGNSYSSFNALAGAAAVGIILIVVSVIATVLLLLLFMKPAKARSYTGKARWLYDLLSFRQFWLGSILKVLYIFTTIYLILYGIYMLFVSFGLGLALLLLGPVLARVVYEMLLLLFSIYHELKEMNDHQRGGVAEPPDAMRENGWRSQPPRAPEPPQGGVVNAPAPREPFMPMPPTMDKAQQTGRRARQPSSAQLSWSPTPPPQSSLAQPPAAPDQPAWQPPTPQSQFSGRYAPAQEPIRHINHPAIPPTQSTQPSFTPPPIDQNPYRPTAHRTQRARRPEDGDTRP